MQAPTRLVTILVLLNASLPASTVISNRRTVSLPMWGTDDWYRVQTESSAYGTGTCVKDEINNRYGKTDNVIKIEHIVWLGTPRAETTRCGWMKFSTAVIPDGAIILSARIRYLVFYWEMNFDFRVTALNVDPVSASAYELYTAIGNGAICAEKTMGRVWDTTELNTAGIEHIQESLHRDWVAFGFWGTDWSHILTERAWILGWNTSPRTDSPWLDVEYSLAALAESDESMSPRTSPASTIAHGVLRVRRGPPARYDRLRLMNASGCVVQARSLYHSSDGTVILDVSHFQSGVYYITGQEPTTGITNIGRIVLAK